MRGFIGLCLLTTGLAIGAYSHYPGAQHREDALVELTYLVTGATPAGVNAASLSTKANAQDLVAKTRDSRRVPLPAAGPIQQPSWFADMNAVAAFEQRAANNAKHGLNQSVAAKKSMPVPPAATKPLQIAQHAGPPKPVLRGWRTAVVVVKTSPDTAPTPSQSLKPKTSSERWQLAKAIQRELKRVGCYWGKIDGIWGKGSKWAMADFMRTVNATLPTREPDYFLLQLVSSHTDNICGSGKNDGTQIASRTMPNTSTPPKAAWVTQVAATDMANRSSPVADRSSSVGGQSPNRIETGSVQRLAVVRKRPTQLRGRMSIGALNRDSAPKLVAPPTRISRGVPLDDVGQGNQARDAKANRRLRISAIPDPTSDAPPVARRLEAAERADQSNATQPIQVSPFVAKKRSEAKAKRARALRKAAAKKKKRRRAYRRYRTRSLQSMFMHPLGRR